MNFLETRATFIVADQMGAHLPEDNMWHFLPVDYNRMAAGATEFDIDNFNISRTNMGISEVSFVLGGFAGRPRTQHRAAGVFTAIASHLLPTSEQLISAQASSTSSNPTLRFDFTTSAHTALHVHKDSYLQDAEPLRLVVTDAA